MLFVGSTALAEKKPKKPQEDQVVPAIQAILAAAPQDFAAIKGDFDVRSRSNRGWHTSVSIPGSVWCDVMNSDPTHRGHFPDNYECLVATAGVPDQLLDRYESLVNEVEKATGWHPAPAPDAPNAIPGSSTRGVWLREDRGVGPTIGIYIFSFLGAGAVSNLEFVVYANQKRDQSAASVSSGSPAGQEQPDAARINSEVDSIQASGQYSPLPAPQAIAPAVSLGSTVSRKFENATGYTVTVDLAGPETKEVVLAPGGTQALNLMPGTYKVAAKAQAPNVLPFFGIQNYAAGYEYTSQLVITPR
jgi:hypothetical protein